MTEEQIRTWQDELDYHESRVETFKRKVSDANKAAAHEHYKSLGKRVFKLFITCPAYKWPIHEATRRSIQGVMDHPGIDADFRLICGDADIGRARATTLAFYLRYEKPWEYYLSVDWDIEFRAQDVYNMLCRMEEFDVGCMGGAVHIQNRGT